MYDNKKCILKEARKLRDALWHCSNEEVAESIRRWIKELLEPLAAEDTAEAKYIIESLGDDQVLSEEEYDRRYMAQLRNGADAEVPEAMFLLAHTFWENGEHEKSAPLYKKAAAAGHAYSKWCYGLDLLSGRGIPADEFSGLKLIEEAANLKFEAAIQFMSDAYALGKYGLPKNEAIAASWQRELGSADLIGL